MSLMIQADGRSSRPFAFAIWDEAPVPRQYVVRVSGEFDLAAKPRFTEVLEQVRSGGPERITVDLCDCELIDSAAMKALVEAAEDCRARATRFSVTCPDGPVRRLMAVAGVAELLSLPPFP